LISKSKKFIITDRKCAKIKFGEIPPAVYKNHIPEIFGTHIQTHGWTTQKYNASPEGQGHVKIEKYLSPV